MKAGLMGLCALALIGCFNDAAMFADENPASGQGGDVEFSLVLPGRATANSLDLTVTCPGFSQTHTIDVSAIVDGVAVAAFGGLPVGTCTVEVVAGVTANDGTALTCSGIEVFPIVDGAIADVTVPVQCGGGTGSNTDGFGGVKLRTAFSVAPADCTADLTRKIFAIPAEIASGQTTIVNAEVQNIQGNAALSFAIDRNASIGDATLALQGSNCSVQPGDCIEVTCVAPGDLHINVDVTDVYRDSTGTIATCLDQESIVIECVAAGSTQTCGNGIVESPEQCDDGPNSTTCPNCGLPCGNGVLDPGEECDGTAGLQDPSVQVCFQCTLLPTCGNGIREGAESCDGLDGLLDPTSEFCTDLCEGPVVIETRSPCYFCITDPTGVIGTALSTQLISCASDTTGCDRALNCYTESLCANGATVSECYCGLAANPDTCLHGSVAPTGACKDLIEELAGPGLTASDYIIFSTDSNTPVGLAFSLFDVAANNAAANCTSECGGLPVDPAAVGPF